MLNIKSGSGTSSTPAFLRAVRPAIGIFQVGYRNRYHHPKAAVFARYGELGIERMRTDELGALTVDIGAAVQPHAYRREHARYWQAGWDAPAGCTRSGRCAAPAAPAALAAPGS